MKRLIRLQRLVALTIYNTFLAHFWGPRPVQDQPEVSSEHLPARSRPAFSFGRLRTEHARQVARLHIEGIPRGFISSLGLDFVTALYQAIAESRTSFGFVGGIVSEQGKVLGFVAFTTNLGRLYKSVVFKNGLRFAFLLARAMVNRKNIKKVLDTLLYPKRTEKLDLPAAELLSIVVCPEARRAGLATQLIEEGFDYCRQLGIDKVKVLVGAGNEAANMLYLRCGFELAGRIENHGHPSNIYVAKLIKTARLEPPQAEAGNRFLQVAEKLRNVAAVL